MAGYIKLTRGPERKLVAVIGETKTGIYYPMLHPVAEARSVYVSNSGLTQITPHSIQALSLKIGHIPVYEGDSIMLEF